MLRYVVLFALLLVPVSARADALADAMAAHERHDDQAAVAIWKSLALKGNPQAQYDLGVAYAKGVAVDRDTAQALVWFTRAADQGNVDAQFVLGHAFDDGWWGSLDAGQAMSWFRKAAEQGHAAAQFYLAMGYLSGRSGVPRDYGEAVKWLRKSADQGDAEAQFMLSQAYALGHGIATDSAEAYFWCSLALKHGDTTHGQVCAETGALLAADKKAGVEKRVADWHPVPAAAVAAPAAQAAASKDLPAAPKP